MYAYVYQAALLCEDCGVHIQQIRSDYAPSGVNQFGSDFYPDGPHGDGGGEADSPQHCDICGVFLDNPLTGDGETNVHNAFREFVETGNGVPVILREWRAAYSWVWDDYADDTFAGMLEAGNVSDLMQRRFDELTD